MASSKQERTIARILKVDPSATHRDVEGLVLIDYTPRWERGRHKGGEFVANPNPQRITHVITEDGRIQGWGYGPLKVKLPAGVTVTTAESMADALKARADARRPEQEAEKVEEPTTEPTATKPKATPRKRTTRARKTGAKS